jgi:hypothetical protein
LRSAGRIELKVNNSGGCGVLPHATSAFPSAAIDHAALGEILRRHGTVALKEIPPAA